MLKKTADFNNILDYDKIILLHTSTLRQVGKLAPELRHHDPP